jgi:hypothetical protein
MTFRFRTSELQPAAVMRALSALRLGVLWRPGTETRECQGAGQMVRKE